MATPPYLELWTHLLSHVCGSYSTSSYFNLSLTTYAAFTVLGGWRALFALILDVFIALCVDIPQQILHSLSSYDAPSTYKSDIRFWLPTFDVRVTLNIGSQSYGSPQPRPKTKIKHKQFGIYARLRWKYRLIPGSHFHASQAKPHRVDSPQYGPDGPENDWGAYWDSHFDLYTYVQTQKYVEYKYGMPSWFRGIYLERLLTQNEPLDAYAKYRALSHIETLSTKKSRGLPAAFVAATGLVKALGVERASNISQKGAYLTDNQHRSDVPIVIDSGSSISVTPFIDDFTSNLTESDIPSLQGLTDKAMVQGQGKVEWKIRDPDGRVALIHCTAYYVPDASIRLHSPQASFMENVELGRTKGRCVIDHKKVKYITPIGDELHFHHNEQSNLPLMFVDHEVPEGGLTSRILFSLTQVEDYEGHISSLLHEQNYNLTPYEKELMMWHTRLGHMGFGWLQRLMQKRKSDVGGRHDPPVIPTKDARTPNCSTVGLKCAACQLGKQHARPIGSTRTQAVPERTQVIKNNTRDEHLRPGSCISMDQYVCKTPGRLATSYGKEDQSKKYTGGTIFVDHASGFIFIKNQVSLRVGETLVGKHELESFCHDYGIKVRGYHADNFPFTASDFLEDMKLQDQEITLSGVSAHHQNGISERNIRTITLWARTMMLELLIHWPKEFRADLWPFAMEHAVYLWNHIPRDDTGLSPFEAFTGSKQPSHDVITRAKVLFSPVYVLDPKLAEGHRLPKWRKRSRLGMYLGNSEKHSSTVGRILNLNTGFVSPQYHVVHDERFTTVSGFLTKDVFDSAEWNELFRLKGHQRIVDHVGRDDVDPSSDFFDDFVSTSTPPPANASSVSEGDTSDTASLTDSDDDSETSDSAGDDEDSEGGIRTRYGRVSKPGPRYAGTFLAQPRPTTVRMPKYKRDQYSAGGNPNQTIKTRDLNASYLQGLDWTLSLADLRSQGAKSMLIQTLQDYDHDNGTLELLSPMALGAKANDADTPNYHQAMNGPNAPGFWEASRKEIETLVKMGVWEVVKREPWMNVIPTTWAFKIKRFPSGLVRKLKARLCVRGDLEIENVHFWETFAPVVNWTTVRLLLLLSAQLELETLQVDYTAAFVHAEVDTPPGYEQMSAKEKYRASQFAEMPRGFSEPGKVLRLRKNLYGKKSAPRLWFHHLKARLESPECGFKQMIDVDPCLFISKKVICLVYVDDTLLYARNREDIDEVIHNLRHVHKMTLEAEDSVAGFLGVHIERNTTTGEVTLTQKGLIERIVEALHIEHLPPVDTPATECLGKDEFGEEANCQFNYASVLGMIGYVYGHSRPELGFAYSQAARFAYNPKRCHELALIRIGQYLKGTKDQGLILKPMTTTRAFRMDCYVDSDFLGLYGKERRDDPDNVKCRAGHVLMVNGVPIVWQSKLIPAICLSTMMAEYYALSMAMREVLPLRELTKTVAAGLGISDSVNTGFKVTCWEDNSACTTLANLEPGQSTPRSKFYDSKVHWFRSHLSPSSADEDDPNLDGIWVKQIGTDLQLADLFTKPLTRETFQRLRKLLMGW